MLQSGLMSSSFCDLGPVFIGSLWHLAAIRSEGSQNTPGMIFFTHAALLPLHSSCPRLIGPSPPGRPVSPNPHSETDTVLQPRPRMDPPATVSSSTLEWTAEGHRDHESKLDPRPSYDDM